jgi:hypothetical protein
VAIKPEGTIPLTGPGNITDITNEDTKKLSVFGPRGYTASQNGPLFGPETGLDREEFVFKGLPARPGRAAAPACAVGLSEPRRKAIVDNMNCEKCHDSSTDRGLLNAGTSLASFTGGPEHGGPDASAGGVAENPSLKLGSAEEGSVQCLKAEYPAPPHLADPSRRVGQCRAMALAGSVAMSR